MTSRTADIVSLIAVAVTFATSMLLYPGMPDPVPSHWNAAGEVDGYMAKPWMMAVLFGSVLMTWGIFKLVLRLSRKDDPERDVAPILSAVQAVSVVFMCGVTELVLLAASGFTDLVPKFLPAGIGLLFVYVGITLGKVARNRYLGIRTPWSMVNDDIWHRTNRFAGWCFVASGIALIALSLSGERPLTVPVIVTLVAVLAVLPTAYSYLLYRRLGPEPDNRQDR